MILISTDKAVRPSNVMGASKRFAELIVQNFSERFLRGRTTLIPLPPKRQHELFETCEIKWMQVNMEDNVSSCVEELLNIIREEAKTPSHYYTTLEHANIL